MTAFEPRAVETPEQLRALMQEDFTFSDQQFAVVTAPLSPHVVVAGAGSGKTTVMAARVVWLVATGQVRPDEVLGLTFTTKAANELAVRIRSGLQAAGILPPPGTRRRDLTEEGEDTEPEEPTVATYNAYAASLLTEHGLRIGHEPDTRVIADAVADGLVARASGASGATTEPLAEWEAELLAAVNKLGIGPMGLGGSFTCLGVKIAMAPCHIASLPLAVNVQCHSARHEEVEF